MKAGWVETTLGDVAHWSSGGTPKAGSPVFYGGDIPWAVIGDLTDGVVSATAQTITDAGLAASSAKVVAPGTLLLAMYGSIGKLGIAGVPMATNQAIACASVVDGVDSSYVFHYLKSQRSAFNWAGNGGTQNNISQTILKAWPIPLPPLAEQHRIARILDRASAIRAHAGQKSALLDALAVSMFRSATADATTKSFVLRDLLTRIDSGKSPVCDGQPADDSAWGVLKLGAVSAGEYRPRENKATLNPDDVDERLEVASGDVLLVRKNTLDLVGASAYVWETPARRLLPDLIFRLVPRADAPVRPVYLQAALAQPSVRSTIRRLSGGSAGSMPNVSKQRLLTISVDVPDVQVQEQYERHVGVVRAARLVDARRRGEMDDLLAALQSRAFSGEL